METDKLLLELFDKKENSYKDFWEYENLSHGEKMRIFDLITNREPVIKTKIKEEIHKYIQKHSNKANKKLNLYWR